MSSPHNSSDNFIEEWELFPLLSQHFKQLGWVYDGLGRWSRSDYTVRTYKDANTYLMEMWTVDGEPVLKQRHFLKNDIDSFYKMLAEWNLLRN